LAHILVVRLGMPGPPLRIRPVILVLLLKTPSILALTMLKMLLIKQLLQLKMLSAFSQLMIMRPHIKLKTSQWKTIGIQLKILLEMLLLKQKINFLQQQTLLKMKLAKHLLL